MSDIFENSFLEGQTYETPFFLFSKKEIIKNIEGFKKYFPGAEVHYAMKANSEPEILKLISDQGIGFEVASVYELNILKEIGIPAKKVIYGTSVKPSKHIKECFKYGVDRYAFDSFSELEKIAAMAPGSRVYARVSVNETGSVFKFSEKFGASMDSVASLLIRAKGLGLVPYGISFHVGSQASNLYAWANALKNLTPVLEELKKANIEIEVINMGGGFPCVYTSTEHPLTLEDIARVTLEQYEQLPYKPKIILEPGRAIIACAGVLVTSIISRIERSGHTWIFLDAGVYNALFESMAYQGSTRYRVSSMRVSYDAGESLFALAGPTGDSPDIITREVSLPQDIEVGEKLVVHNVGAYSVVNASRFNGFPKPPVYLV